MLAVVLPKSCLFISETPIEATRWLESTSRLGTNKQERWISRDVCSSHPKQLPAVTARQDRDIVRQHRSKRLLYYLASSWPLRPRTTLIPKRWDSTPKNSPTDGRRYAFAGKHIDQRSSSRDARVSTFVFCSLARWWMWTSRESKRQPWFELPWSGHRRCSSPCFQCNFTSPLAH